MDQPVTAPARYSSVPGTLLIGSTDPDEVWIGTEIVFEEADGPFDHVVVRARSDEKWIPCTELTDPGDRTWTGRVWSDDGPGPVFVVRPTIEADAATSITMRWILEIPLPIEVITYLHADNGGMFDMPHLYAMCDDDGWVVTMMLVAHPGIYVRSAQAWERLVDDDLVDGLTVHEVDGAALAVFDHVRTRVLVHEMTHNGLPVGMTPAEAWGPGGGR